MQKRANKITLTTGLTGTLRKLAVKELNKYTECHNLHGAYIRMNEKAI